MIPGSMRLGSTREIILPHIDKTETFLERTRGLLGCKELKDGHGLLIAQCSSIHTFFMKIPIDVAFLDKDNTIVKIKPNLKPYTIAMSLGAASVLEMMSGQISLINIHEGDQLIWEAVT